MNIALKWTKLTSIRHVLWDDTMCLYAYLNPQSAEVLYLGKADYSTLRTRLRGEHKTTLFEDLERERGITRFPVLHGGIIMSDGGRRTSAVIADVESLLIKRLQPWGNIQSRRQRIARPGMRVTCTGDWSLARSHFRDSG